MAKHTSQNEANRSPRKPRGASRDLRSASPTKVDPPSDRVILSPKKRGRKAKKQSETAGMNGASKALQNVMESPATVVESAAAVADAVADQTEPLLEAAAEAVNGVAAADDDDGDDEYKPEEDESIPDNAARVTVTQEVSGDGDDEVKHTKVQIDMPTDGAEGALPATSEEALVQAQAIVEAGIALQAESEASRTSPRRGRKRKASEVEAELDGDEDAAPGLISPSPSSAPVEAAESEDSGRPSKRLRTETHAEEVVREKMQRRAIVGLSATLAVGAMIPFLSNLF